MEGEVEESSYLSGVSTICRSLPYSAYARKMHFKKNKGATYRGRRKGGRTNEDQKQKMKREKKT